MDTILQTGLSNAVVASALALVAVLVGYICRRPALVHGLWLLVLLKLVTLPLVPITITWPALAEPKEAAAAPVPPNASDIPLSPDAILEAPRPSEDVPQIVVQANPEPETPELPSQPAPTAPAPTAPFPWQMLLGGIWLTGSLAWFLLAGWRVWCFRRLLRFAAPAPVLLRQMAEGLARKMDLHRYPAVYLIPGRLAPMLWAMGGRPWLLVPRELLNHLSRAQLETLLAHELAHLKRRDHWVRGLEFLAMGLYWWHPVVWYARHALREAEEQCCDAWVVSQLPDAGKTYATALLEALDFLSDARPATPLLASGIGQVSDLKRRLTMILCASTPRALSWRGTLAVMSLGLFALPLLPTFARAQPTPEKPVEIQVEGLRLQLDQGVDPDKAKAELEKAHAELARLQAAVKATQVRIKALEDQLAAEKGGKVGEKAKDGEIEIILRKVGDKWEIVQAPAAPKTTTLWRVEEKDGRLRVVPVDPNKLGYPMPQPEPKPGYKPVPPVPPTTKPVEPQDSRIENLERQLKRIMGELEELRREMKQPGKSGTTPDDGARNKRLEELKRSLPPGAKVEEKDGRIQITLPTETAPMKSPDPFGIEPKR
jgi:beta-lactamase regulating signal transducer with metallopeptidase domain